MAGILGGFVFDRSTLERIAYDRGLTDVSDYEELSEDTKALLKADLAYAAYYSPNVWASDSQSHNGYSKSRGSQTLNEATRERLYNLFYNTYKKYDEAKLEEIMNNDASLQWINDDVS